MTYLPLLHPDRLALFDDFFGDRRHSGKAIVPIEVEADEQAVHVRAEIPGLRKEDIVIEYQDGVLSVSGEKNAHVRKTEKGYHYTEVSVGKFVRKIQMGQDVRFADAEARYDSGVLHVTLPREKQGVVANRLEIK